MRLMCMFLSIICLLGCGESRELQRAKERASEHKATPHFRKKHPEIPAPKLWGCPLDFPQDFLRWKVAPKVVLFDDNGNVMKLTQQKKAVLDVAMNAVKEATDKQVFFSTNDDFKNTIAIFHYCGRNNINCEVDGLNIPKKFRPHYTGADFLYNTRGLSWPYVGGELVSPSTLFNKEDVKYKDFKSAHLSFSTKKQFITKSKNVEGIFLFAPDNTIVGAYCFVNTYHSEPIKNRLISECILRAMGIYTLIDEPGSYLSVKRREDAIYDQPLPIDSVVTDCLRALYRQGE